jgi:hypothetical protein
MDSEQVALVKVIFPDPDECWQANALLRDMLAWAVQQLPQETIVPDEYAPFVREAAKWDWRRVEGVP